MLRDACDKRGSLTRSAGVSNINDMSMVTLVSLVGCIIILVVIVFLIVVVCNVMSTKPGENENRNVSLKFYGLFCR